MNEIKIFYVIVEKIAFKLRSLQVILGKVGHER